ncbi:hypothetical protein GCM10010199_28160 [Dactylosporangium roseum]
MIPVGSPRGLLGRRNARQLHVREEWDRDRLDRVLGGGRRPEAATRVTGSSGRAGPAHRGPMRSSDQGLEILEDLALPAVERRLERRPPTRVR